MRNLQNYSKSHKDEDNKNHYTIVLLPYNNNSEMNYNNTNIVTDYKVEPIVKKEKKLLIISSCNQVKNKVNTDKEVFNDNLNKTVTIIPT